MRARRMPNIDVSSLRTTALATILAILGCANHDAPRAAPLATVVLTDAAVVARDASTDARPEPPPPRAPDDVVEFEGPPFERETPMHGGPDWRFRTTLPARVRATGVFVIPFVADRGLSSVPNLALRFLSRDGARVVRAITILDEREFDLALRRTDVDRRTAFAELGDVVRARVAAANGELTHAGLAPLVACAVDPDNPYAAWPPCGATQTLSCGAATLRYVGGKQTLVTARGRRSFPAWRKPNVRSADGADVAVNECIAGAWLDTESRALVASFANLCAVPGDWCSVPRDWRIVPDVAR